MMTRNDVENSILEFLEGELSPEQERALMAEIEASNEYKALLEQYRRQDRELAAFFSAAQERFVEGARRPDLLVLPAAKTPEAARQGAPSGRWLAVAACAALLIAVGAYLVLPLGGGGVVSHVLASAGTVQAFDSEGIRSLARADHVPIGAQRLKTASDGYLQVALGEGSGSVELNANSLVRLGGSAARPEFKLERGELFVDRKVGTESRRPVRVDTRELRIESAGGTFSVVRGLRGSEVAVASGQVEVVQAGVARRLGAGETYSSEQIRPIPLERRIAWTSAAQVGDTAEPTGFIVSPYGAGVALTTDFLPSETAVLLEVPSLAELIGPDGGESLADFVTAENVRTLLQRLGDLEWEEESGEQFVAGLQTVLRNRDVQTVLGALNGSLSVGLSRQGAVLVADVRSDAEAVEQVINGKLMPLMSLLQMGREEVSARVENGFLIIALNNAVYLETLEAVRTNTPTDFAYSPFVLDLRNTSPSSSITGAVNVARLNEWMLEQDAQRRGQASVAAQRIGFDNLRAIIAATDFGDQAENQALRMTFDGARHGMVGWLDRPGAMGSFQFFSPDTHFLLAMKIQSPEVMLEEALGWLRESRGDNDAMDRSAEAHLVRMVAATLGNEVAIGIDNPLLPIPNVKVAIEVLDPIAFHDAMLALIDLMATSPEADVQRVQVRTETHRNHLVVSFDYPGAPFGVSYTVLEDFVVFGPGSAFVKNTIEMSQDGRSLENEYAFTSSLPAKSGSHVSMLMYQPFSKSAKDLAPLLKNFKGEWMADLMDLAEGRKGQALVNYAIADEDRVDFFVEGFGIGNLEMSGWLPTVAEWYQPVE